MLVELSVHHLALIDHVQLDLDPGFTVFTGETGAGKSILLDAIGLLLGSRASTDVVRHGQPKAVVEAMIDVSADMAAEVQTLLEPMGVECRAGESILLSREIHDSGRSVCRINGRMATVQMLRDLGAILVQQHGQHEHQGLLRAEEQLRLLDLFGKHQDVLSRVAACYGEWNRAKRALQSAQLDEQERMRRLDMLDFQIREIEAGELNADELEELSSRRQRLLFADKIASALQSALAALTGADDQAGVVDLLATAAEQVAAAASHDAQLADTRELVDTAQVHADEAARSLYKYLDGVEQNPELLEQIENRIALIRTLLRKYGPTVENVLQHLASAKKEQQHLLAHEEQMAHLTETVTAAERALADHSDALHDARVQAAKRLSEQVQTVLRELNMPNATLSIIVEPKASTDATGRRAYGPRGVDDVTYLFSANRGEAPKPLQRIASGGELSRTLLAFKSVLADVDAPGTLIFDEIDVGVSGAAAQRIAEQLQKLGRVRQVLCVTHSPQVAAASDHHFCIAKMESEDATSTSVARLDAAGRIAEIGRLIGSDLAGQTAADHAQALLTGFHPAN